MNCWIIAAVVVSVLVICIAFLLYTFSRMFR